QPHFESVRGPTLYFLHRLSSHNEKRLALTHPRHQHSLCMESTESDRVSGLAREEGGVVN
ncbi:MAG: hypothetical protein ACK5CR_20440, partial [Pseudanabaena sp.]